MTEQKEEYEMDRLEITEKLNELKHKLEGREDELNYKNINYEKDAALMKQQIKFAEAKAAEMQTQYERTVQRYEDRIKMDKDEMQRELKDRSQRLLEEKEAAEAKYQAKRKELKAITQQYAQLGAYLALNEDASLAQARAADARLAAGERGPLLGVLFLSLLSELLWANAPLLYMVILGLVLIVFVLVLPQGIMGLLEGKKVSSKQIPSDAAQPSSN